MAQGWKKDYSRYKGFFLNILDLYNSKPNYKIYLELILSITTIILFSVLAIKPTIITILEVNNEIKGKEAIIEKLDKKIDDLQKANDLLQSQSQNLKLIDGAVPNDPELDSVLGQIENLSISNSLQIVNLEATELVLKGLNNKNEIDKTTESLPENSNELSLSFSVNGDYQNLFNFLQSIENLQRPIKMDTFTFNTNRSLDDSKVIALTISGRFPYLILAK